MTTERELLELIDQRFGFESFGARRYAVAHHVPQNPSGHGPIADAIVQDCWKGRDAWPLLGFEVKCFRSDWLAELRNPAKSQAWARYCTRWYLVAADETIVRNDLPAGWGMLVARGKRLVTVAAAPKLKPEPMPHQTHAALLRQVQKAADGRDRERVRLREIARELNRVAAEQERADVAFSSGVSYGVDVVSRAADAL